MLAGLAVLPLLIGLGVSGADPVELESLRMANDSLRLENDSYRAATGELAEQISSLQTALSELGDQGQLDPAARQALERLPAVVRSRSAGGEFAAAARLPVAPPTETPESTFGLLRGLLGAIETRLASVKTKVADQQALLRATPSTWPVIGWLTSVYGNRKDPFTGEPDFHAGLDISAQTGTPVKATADGTVEMADINGNYGKCIVIAHGFGIGTRFGHLSGFAVRPGQQVRRGDIIGYVGSTGRATSSHLHYEILINGQPINPLRVLSRP